MRLRHQAIVEFVAAVTRPIRGDVILPNADALREAQDRTQFTVLYPNEAILREALRACAAYQLNWSDAHLWSYAEHYRLSAIFTEDLQHDRLYGSVRVLNPFITDAHRKSHLLAGLLACACGKPVYTKTSGGGNYYCCSSCSPGYGPKRGAKSVRQLVADRMIEQFVTGPDAKF